MQYHFGFQIYYGTDAKNSTKILFPCMEEKTGKKISPV